jgi:maleylacetoacetate isomerase
MSGRLYTYFRSSAAYRVRIALALKGMDWTPQAIHLRRGEQAGPDFRKVNPLGLLPVWEADDLRLAQSLAIVEYLDEIRPAPPLLPGDARQRAEIRAFAQTIACDIHPLNNLRVLGRLRSAFGAGDEAVTAWIRGWIAPGLSALEAMLGSDHARRFCYGDGPTLADICLVPQLYNARRYGLDLAPYPILTRIDAHCRTEPAFLAAAPERQPDLE